MKTLAEVLGDTNTTLLAEARAHAGEPRDFRLTRDDALDLAFDGWLVAEGRCGDRAFEIDWTRWTVVRLHVTRTGKYVVALQRHSKWEGQNSRYAATVHDTFEEVVEHLTDDNDGRLGPASKAMIEDAVTNIRCLSGADVERI